MRSGVVSEFLQPTRQIAPFLASVGASARASPLAVGSRHPSAPALRSRSACAAGKQVVAGEGSAGFEGVEGGETGLRPFGEAAGDREVEVDERRRRGARASSTVAASAMGGPVRSSGLRVCVPGRSRPAAGTPPARGTGHREGLPPRVIDVAIPAGAILQLERDQVSRGIRTSIPPGVLQQHQGQEASRLVLRSRRDQLEGERDEADRLGGEVDPQRGARLRSPSIPR